MRLTRQTLALLLTLLLPAAASATTEPLTPQATLTAAARAIDTGELNRAELLLLELLDRSPSTNQRAGAFLGLSRVSELRGDPEAALQHARRAEEVDPDSPATVFAVGRSLARLGASREAIDALERARQLSPDDPAPAILEALILRDDGKHDEAASVLEEVWTAGLRGPDVSSQLASLHLTLDNPARTLEIVDEALIEMPTSSTLVLLKGLALGKDIDRRQEAIAWLRKALDLGPPNPGRVWLELAIMLLDEGDWEAALAALEEARAFRQNDPEVYYRLGTAYRMAGDRDNAVDALKRFQELRRQADTAGSLSKRLGTELNVAFTLAEQNKLPEALSKLDEILAEAPDNARVHASRAKVLYSMGQTGDALVSATRALEIDPGRSEHHLLAGVFLLDLGRFREAETALRHALDLDPRLSDVHTALAGSLVKQGRPEEALEHFDRAIELGGDSTSVRLGYAAALEELGRTEEADAQMAEYRELRETQRQTALQEQHNDG